jgi:hypothetical protein
MCVQCLWSIRQLKSHSLQHIVTKLVSNEQASHANSLQCTQWSQLGKINFSDGTCGQLDN